MNENMKTLGCAVASVVFVATGVAILAPRNSVAVAEVATAAVIEARADAAAGVTFKIVPAEAAGTKVSWAPLTGDGSN